MLSMFTLILLFSLIEIPRAQTSEHNNSPLSDSTTHNNTMISVPMQSVFLPCKAALSHSELEQVMWYKLMKSGQSTLSVGKHLISKDNRFSVAYHDFDHGHSPARWDLHIQRIRFSDAADYQCHCVSKSGQYSTRSTINLIVQDIFSDIQPTERHLSTGDVAVLNCSFSGQHRIRQGNVIWLKDGKFIQEDENRVIKNFITDELTISTLEILNSQSTDTGFYRCSDGQHALSQEAKLYIKDEETEKFLRSASSSTSTFSSDSYRTVTFLVVSIIFSLN